MLCFIYCFGAWLPVLSAISWLKHAEPMWLSQSLLVLLWCHFLSSARVQSWLFSTMMHEFTSPSQAACHGCVFVSSQCRTAFAKASFLFKSAMVSISKETGSLNRKFGGLKLLFVLHLMTIIRKKSAHYKIF